MASEWFDREKHSWSFLIRLQRITRASEWQWYGSWSLAKTVWNLNMKPFEYVVTLASTMSEMRTPTQAPAQLSMDASVPLRCQLDHRLYNANDQKMQRKVMCNQFIAYVIWYHFLIKKSLIYPMYDQFYCYKSCLSNLRLFALLMSHQAPFWSGLAPDLKKFLNAGEGQNSIPNDVFNEKEWIGPCSTSALKLGSRLPALGVLGSAGAPPMAVMALKMSEPRRNSRLNFRWVNAHHYSIFDR